MQELNLTTGRAAEVQCDKGYDLVGEALVVCVGGGAWSSAFPVCQRESRRQKNQTKQTHPSGRKLHLLLPVLLRSQALPASSGLEGRRRRRVGAPDGLPRGAVGPRHLPQGSGGERQRHHHLQAGPDVEPRQLRVPK